MSINGSWTTVAPTVLRSHSTDHSTLSRVPAAA